MATIEHISNIFIEKIDEKNDNELIIKNVLGMKKPIIISINNKNKTLSISAYTYKISDVSYIENLIDLEQPIYFNINHPKYNKFYGYISNLSVEKEGGIYNIKFDVNKINDYSLSIYSTKYYINNNIISSDVIEPIVIVLSGTKTNLFEKETIEKYDIYNETVNIYDFVPLSLIKFYDGDNLIGNPNEYEFENGWVIEYCNLRLYNDLTIKIYVNGNWLDYGKLNITDNEIKSTKILSVDYNTIKILVDFGDYAKEFDIIFDTSGIYILDNTIKKYLIQNIETDGYITINSDFICKTGNKESDYTITSGNYGWLVQYNINSNLLNAYYCYSTNSDIYLDTLCLIPLNYLTDIFYKPSGNITDDLAVNNITLSTLTNEITSGKIFNILSGNYKVVFRIKTSTLSTNDTVNFVIKNNDDGTIIKSLTLTAENIGTEYTYISLDYYYDGTYKPYIGIEPGTNIDGTTISFDYMILIPIDEINKWQKRAYVLNNQKILVKPLK